MKTYKREFEYAYDYKDFDRLFEEYKNWKLVGFTSREHSYTLIFEKEDWYSE